MIEKLECPLCRQRTIPRWRRLFISPKGFASDSARCPRCKGKIGIGPSRAWTLFWLEAGVLVVAFHFINSVLISGAVIVAAAAAGFWYWDRHVTLVPYEAAAADG